MLVDQTQERQLAEGGMFLEFLPVTVKNIFFFILHCPWFCLKEKNSTSSTFGHQCWSCTNTEERQSPA